MSGTGTLLWWEWQEVESRPSSTPCLDCEKGTSVSSKHRQRHVACHDMIAVACFDCSWKWTHFVPLCCAAAAPTGEVEQTTEYTKYPHPAFKHLQLWDFPGAGPLKHGCKTYFMDKALYAFDCLVIMTCTRLFHIDLHLVNMAVMHKAVSY